MFERDEARSTWRKRRKIRFLGYKASRTDLFPEFLRISLDRIHGQSSLDVSMKFLPLFFSSTIHKNIRFTRVAKGFALPLVGLQ